MSIQQRRAPHDLSVRQSSDTSRSRDHYIPQSKPSFALRATEGRPRDMLKRWMVGRDSVEPKPSWVRFESHVEVGWVKKEGPDNRPGLFTQCALENLARLTRPYFTQAGDINQSPELVTR